MRRVSRRFDIFWIAAIHCRSGFAVRPRATLISRHVSCRSGSAVRVSESESNHRFVSGNASCLLMRMKRYRTTYGMFYTYREDFLSISFIHFRTYVRETKAGLASRTPKVHPDSRRSTYFFVLFLFIGIEPGFYRLILFIIWLNPTSKMNGSTAQKTLVPWCIYSLSFLH